MIAVSKPVWLCVLLMGAALLILAKQQPHAAAPAPEPVSDSQDIQEVVHEEQTALAGKDAEINSLELQLHDVQLAARGVGLMDLEPSDWESGWTATWYDASGDEMNGSGITASGQRVHDMWTVAADTSILPMGTLIQVKFPDGSTRVYQVLDRGGAIKGKRLDIYEPSMKQCFTNGRQHVEIRILKMG